MPTQQITDGTLATTEPVTATDGEGSLRDLAIKQIARKRQFHIHAVVSAALTVLLVAIWAAAEYSNAGGWPTDGFSQSSGISHVWNTWIIYPVIGIGLLLAGRAWFTFREAVHLRERDPA